MWLAGLIALAASAGVPDALRDDGSIVFGCTSMEALDLTPTFAPGADGVVDLFQSLGVDGDQPFWVVLAERNGHMLPVQVLFSLPEGQTVPALVRMMPGSPRVQQDGTEVQITLGGKRVDPPTGLHPLMQQVKQGRDQAGCLAGMVYRTDEPLQRMAISTGLDGSMRVLLDGADTLRGPLPSGGDIGARGEGFPAQALVALLADPAPPRRPAWASTEDRPSMALRLNAHADLPTLLQLLMPSQADQDLPKTLDKVVLEPGGQAAIWPSDGPPEFALVAPIRKPRTVRWWPGRIAKAVRKGGQSTQRRGRVFGVPGPSGSTVWLTARKRRLIVATDPDRAEQLRDPDVGRPWIDGGFEAHSDGPDAPGMLIVAAERGTDGTQGLQHVHIHRVDDAIEAIIQSVPKPGGIGFDGND